MRGRALSFRTGQAVQEPFCQFDLTGDLTMTRLLPMAFMTFLGGLAFVTCGMSQTMPSFPAPTKEHEFLKQFEGDWDFDSEGMMVEGQPPLECTGEMHGKMLGGFWIVSQSTTNSPGQSVNAIQTIGYDPEKKKYIGTWIDSMMGHMWKYEGEVDAGGKKLVLEADGPNFTTPGKTSRFRDAYEFKTKDHILVTSSMQDDNGEWIPFMTGNFRRKK